MSSDQLEPKDDIVSTESKKRVKGKPKRPEAKCLTPECNGKFAGDVKPGGGRGLCHTCHQAALSLVKRNVTTWNELERLGLAEPKYGSLVERALIKKRRELTDGNNNGQ